MRYRNLLSKKHLGEYTLIYGGKIQDILPTEDETMRAGDQAAAFPWAVIKIVPKGQRLRDRTTIRKISVLRTPLMSAA